MAEPPEWRKDREQMAPADELKFLERMLGTRITDSSLERYVKERIRALQEELKKAGNL